MSKKTNETLTRLLPELLQRADPIQHEGDLSEADAARMRRILLAEAAASEPALERPEARPGLFWIPAAAAAALAVGLGLVLLFALTNQDRSDGETVAAGAPHGTRLLRTDAALRPTGEAPAGTGASPALDLPAEPPPFPPSPIHRAPAPTPRPARPAASPIAPSAASPSGRASLPSPPSAPAPETAPVQRAAAVQQATEAPSSSDIERFPSSLPEPARLARAEPPSIETPRSGKPPRRLNLTAPGGTRILWVIDPELEIDSTDTTDTTSER